MLGTDFSSWLALEMLTRPPKPLKQNPVKGKTKCFSRSQISTSYHAMPCPTTPARRKYRTTLYSQKQLECTQIPNKPNQFSYSLSIHTKRKCFLLSTYTHIPKQIKRSRTTHPHNSNARVPPTHTIILTCIRIQPRSRHKTVSAPQKKIK